MKRNRTLLLLLGAAVLAGGIFIAMAVFDEKEAVAAPSCVGCDYFVPYSISGDWPRSGSCLLRASSWKCYVGGTHIRSLPFVTSCDWATAPYPPSTPGYKPGYEYVTYIWCDSYVPAPSASISASGPGTLLDGETGTVSFRYSASSADSFSWSVSTAVGSRSGSGSTSGTVSGSVGGRLPDSSPGTTQTYCGSIRAVNVHGGRSDSDSDCTTVNIVAASPTASITLSRSRVMPGEPVPITITLTAGRNWYQADWTLRVLGPGGQQASDQEVRSPRLTGSFKDRYTATLQLMFGSKAAGKTYTVELTVTNTHGKTARATTTLSVEKPPTSGGGEDSRKILVIRPSIRITSSQDAELIVAWQNLTNIKLSVNPGLNIPGLPADGKLSDNQGSYAGSYRFTLPSSLWRQAGIALPATYTFTVTGKDRLGQTYEESATLMIDQDITRLLE
ncbi:MAG: hypothetical protein KM310_10885 [Clostridiales bacterium]|nr:hypothetical protein [Clostridiales bacterium]